MDHTPRVAVFGAGNIGCYVGGRLLAAGCDVRFIGRPGIQNEIRERGLHISDYLGSDIFIPGNEVEYTQDPHAAEGMDLVIVAVKSAATPEVGTLLDRILKPHAVVLSLQNGMHNVEALDSHMPQQTVLAGMVPFNVVKRAPGAYHQGSEGDLTVQNDPSMVFFQPWFESAGIPLELSDDMPGVQWGKMLLNLNNPINALSNLPLKAEISDRTYRRCLAAAQREAMQVYKAAGIRPDLHIMLPAGWLPSALELPNFLFSTAASKMLEIDPVARSSMWEDLQAGHKTEIEYLNGEVVRLAESAGVPAPVNAKLVELIHAAENGGRREWSGPELLKELQRAT
jgi:2-dehydropantoate 2-reductase